MAFRFEHLEIWKSAVAFNLKIYTSTRLFPREELFSLTDQLKRASISISANIAEGSGSSSKKDFMHYLDIAIKSCYETVSHLFIARDQKYISKTVFEDLYKDAEMLSRKIRSFKISLLKNS